MATNAKKPSIFSQFQKLLREQQFGEPYSSSHIKEKESSYSYTPQSYKSKPAHTSNLAHKSKPAHNNSNKGGRSTRTNHRKKRSMKRSKRHHSRRK